MATSLGAWTKVASLFLLYAGLFFKVSPGIAGSLTAEQANDVTLTTAFATDFAALAPLFGVTPFQINGTSNLDRSGWILNLTGPNLKLNYVGNFNKATDTSSWSGTGTYANMTWAVTGSSNFAMNTWQQAGTIGSNNYNWSGNSAYTSPNSMNPTFPFNTSLTGQVNAANSNIATNASVQDSSGSGTVFPGDVDTSMVVGNNPTTFGYYGIDPGGPPLYKLKITSIPEIDPGSIAGALTLSIGGVLALTGRRRRQSIVLASG